MPQYSQDRHTGPPLDLESTGENYYISLSDLMVGILFVFLILLTFFALQSKVYEQENVWLKKLDAATQSERLTLVQAARRTGELEEQLKVYEERLTNTDRLRAELLQQLQRALIERDVAVEIDPDRGVLRLPQAMLFDPGSASLRVRGTEALQRLAEVLQEVVTAPTYMARLESIYIEGHTDNLPIRTANFRDNLSLSAARAMNTYQALIVHAPRLQLMHNSEDQALFGISGYGDQRAIGDNNSESGRVKNRRIDFRFVMSAPSAMTPNTSQLPSPSLP
jgi:chemotaxis protein MotB